MMEGTYTLRRLGWDGSAPAFRDYPSWAEMERYHNTPIALPPGGIAGGEGTRSRGGAVGRAGIGTYNDGGISPGSISGVRGVGGSRHNDSEGPLR